MPSHRFIDPHRGALVAVVASVAVTTAIGVRLVGDADRPDVAIASAAPQALAAPISLQQQFVDVVRTVSPQVVQVQTGSGLGSGVVFDDRGHIVTNAHVVAGARRFVVTLANGRHDTARLVGADVAHDIAVIRLLRARPTAARFAPTRGLQVGQIVLAIGNPLGLRSSVTEGIISSLGRRIPEGDGITLSSVIQTSAAINPGNSGGALVDLAGRVVGIPTLAALDPELGGAATDIGFAIPAATVRQTATRLIAGAR